MIVLKSQHELYALLSLPHRLRSGAKKVKFVVNSPLPGDHAFPSFRDFTVHHHYLQTNSRMMQSRLRKRGRKGKWSYTHTIRKQVSGTLEDRFIMVGWFDE